MIKTIKKIYYNQKIRFLFVSGLNTSLGFAIFWVLTYFCNINYLYANFLCLLAATINSYFWNKYFVFKTNKKSIKEIIKFISVYAVQFAIGNLFLVALVELLNFNEYVAWLLCIFVSTLVSFIGHKFFTFKGEKNG